MFITGVFRGLGRALATAALDRGHSVAELVKHAAILLAALLATGWGLAGAYLLHIQLSPLSVALGSLTTATACEFTVLLAYASERGRRAVRTTVAVAALAAALGYLALAVSSLAVLVQFGLLLAATVGLSLAAATAVVRLLPPRPERSAATPPSAEVLKREATV